MFEIYWKLEVWFVFCDSDYQVVWRQICKVYSMWERCLSMSIKCVCQHASCVFDVIGLSNETAVWKQKQQNDGVGSDLKITLSLISSLKLKKFGYVLLFLALCIFGSVDVTCVVIFFFSLFNLFYIKCHSACQTRLFRCNFGCCSCLMTVGGFDSPLAPLSSQTRGFVMVCFEWTDFMRKWWEINKFEYFSRHPA